MKLNSRRGARPKRTSSFDSLETIFSYTHGDDRREDVGFQGDKLFWTDGTTVKPLTIRQAFAWWTEMSKECNDVQGAMDNTIYPQPMERFMGMVTQSLPVWGEASTWN